jgi:hypothetical protein
LEPRKSNSGNSTTLSIPEKLAEKFKNDIRICKIENSDVLCIKIACIDNLYNGNIYYIKNNQIYIDCVNSKDKTISILCEKINSDTKFANYNDMKNNCMGDREYNEPIDYTLFDTIYTKLCLYINTPYRPWTYRPWTIDNISEIKITSLNKKDDNLYNIISTIDSTTNTYTFTYNIKKQKIEYVSKSTGGKSFRVKHKKRINRSRRLHRLSNHARMKRFDTVYNNSL